MTLGCCKPTGKSPSRRSGAAYFVTGVFCTRWFFFAPAFGIGNKDLGVVFLLLSYQILYFIKIIYNIPYPCLFSTLGGNEESNERESAKYECKLNAIVNPTKIVFL